MAEPVPIVHCQVSPPGHGPFANPKRHTSRCSNPDRTFGMYRNCWIDRGRSECGWRLEAECADGVISVVANEIPALVRQMVAAALAGDFAKARKIHERILPLMTGNFIESNPIPAKAVMKMLGILSTDVVRSPLAPLSEASRTRLREILEECGLA